MTRPAKGKKISAGPASAPRPADDDARLVVDEDGRIVYASDSFAGLVNRPAAKLTGQYLTSFLEFARPDEAFGARTLTGGIGAINEGTHRASLTGHAGAAFVLLRFDRVTARDGRVFTVGAEVSDTDARPAAFGDQIMRLLETIQQKPPAEPAPKIGPDTADGELLQFLDMSHDLLAVSSRDGIFRRVNGLLNDALGYTDEDLRRMSFMDLIHPEDRPPVRASFIRLMRDETCSGQIISFEARIRTRDGRILWTDWRQKRLGDLLYSVGRDVSAIKEQEEALKRQREQLDEAQAIAHMGHWRWGVGSDDIEWSDEIYRIFGVDRAAFRPSLEAVNAMLHRRDIGRMLQAFQRAIIEHANYEMDCRIVRPDGEIRTLRCEGKCEENAGGEVIALFGIMQDITQRMKQESDLRYAKESAERAYAAKSQFLANMSHELRTPLNAIIGFSEMMQRQLLGPIGTARYLDYINGIRESGEHLLDLISDILDMSKIEAGKYELECEEFGATKIIRLAAHMMEGRAQSSSIRLSVVAAAEDLLITADRRALMQILLNLLSNAIKFTDPAGTVTIECAGRPDHIMIRVQDTGIGIPASKIAYITRPFEQAASSYTRAPGQGGTGLGLAITKDLIEMHGGNLLIESTEGVGTTVTVHMPHDARPFIKTRPKTAG